LFSWYKLLGKRGEGDLSVGDNNGFLVLVILDGWGLGEEEQGNAILQAHTPNMDYYQQNFPFTRLVNSGEAVGLPPGQMGNSEVGHLNLGAGRIVYQEIMRISKAIEDGSFFHNDVLSEAMQKVREKGAALHLMGLLSDGGVHSHNTHLYALLEMAARIGVKEVYVHAVLDGRDTAPRAAETYLKELEQKFSSLGAGVLASIVGRYYTMDRDHRWERIEKAYRAYVYGEGEKAAGGIAALDAAYRRGEDDEFVLPTVIVGEKGKPLSLIKEQDSLIFFNFRADRARQISRTFLVSDFDGFARGEKSPFPHYVCFTQYDRELQAPVAFPPDYLTDTLGEVFSKHGLQQLRIAETEKYAHVTYFFSGGREEPFSGEERKLIPSPQVPTYDLQPEMSAPEVTDEVLRALEEEKYSLVVLNYANTDMVGHTGNLGAAVKAAAAVDYQLGRVVERVLQKGGIVLVTSDHGNAEKMMMPDDSPHTAHNNNETPFIIISAAGSFKLAERGKLADAAPTILKLFSMPVPRQMEGVALF